MLLPIGPLPDDPLGAAAAFHAEWLPRVLAELAGGADAIILVFAPTGAGSANIAHVGWREAAVQLLARERTPARVNAIVGADPAAVAAVARFIDGAPGLTGQVLVTDGHGAKQVLS